MTLRDIRLCHGGLVLQTSYRGGYPTPDSPPPPPSQPVRIGIEGQDGLIVLEGPMKGIRGEFLRDEGRRIVWLRLTSRIHVRRD
jgi:hypothetical protein